MRKKIKIITYCTWKSIGSILQAYALSSVLNSIGFENELWIEEKNRLRKKHNVNNYKIRVRQILELLHEKKINVAYNKRSDFINTKINIEYYINQDEFTNGLLEKDLNVYLAGSDQIWNPDICNPIYFLDFARGEHCISYAASMGKTEITDKKSSFFLKNLKNFNFISVRERECAEVLSAYTDKEIFVHIDPTFLINTETWRSLEHPYKVKKSYILLYMLYWDNSYKEQIVALKKRTGLPVYAICSGISGVYADKRIYDAGVEEFLWLVDHAEYVITSSFHGVAFSIIFQKKFAAVINPASPSRIENVLNILSVPRVKIEELDHAESIDYSIISANIEKERQRSIEYLKEAIG